MHALEACGKDLSRERLVTALEGLYEYETGLMPKITYGPNRRIGALGAYVVTMARTPSDVLAVEYLQQRAGLAPPTNTPSANVKSVRRSATPKASGT